MRATGKVGDCDEQEIRQHLKDGGVDREMLGL
jgi:hypothetical protein